MDDDEIEARLAGLRILLAFAIKATCRNPAEVQSRVASLQELAGLIPGSLHPGVKDEVDSVIAALTRLPVRDPLSPPTVFETGAQRTRDPRLPEADRTTGDDYPPDVLF